MRPVVKTQTGAGSTAWIPTDYIQTPFAVSLFCTVTGTVDYTVEHTPDDIFDPTVTPTVYPHEFLVNQSTTADGNYAFPVRATRLTINSGDGSVTFTVLQGLGG